MISSLKSPNNPPSCTRAGKLQILRTINTVATIAQAPIVGFALYNNSPSWSRFLAAGLVVGQVGIAAARHYLERSACSTEQAYRELSQKFQVDIGELQEVIESLKDDAARDAVMRHMYVERHDLLYHWMCALNDAMCTLKKLHLNKHNFYSDRGIATALDNMLKPFGQVLIQHMLNRETKAGFDLAVHVFDPRKARLTLRARTSSYGWHTSEPPREWEPGIGFCGRCYTSGRPIFATDAGEHKSTVVVESKEDESQYRSLFVLPVLESGLVVGTLTIATDVTNLLEEKTHAPIVQALAGLVSFLLTASKSSRVIH